MPPTRGFGLSATGRLLLLVSAFVLVLGAIACSDQHPELESARNAYERGDYDLAIQHYTNAINSGELSDDVLGTALYDRGGAYLEKRLYDEAIRDYSEAIRLNPDAAGAFNDRGNAYARKGLYDEAIRDYDEAIRLNPIHHFFFNNRGNAYRHKGLYDEANRDYSEAIRLDLDSAGYFNNRGRRRTGSDDSRSSLAALPSAGPTGSSSKLKPFSSRPTRSACPTAPISV